VNKEKLAYILATAHDLKTPIQSILYALDLLSTDDSTSLSDEQNKLVRQARSAAEIMTSVVCQALDVGKAQSGHDLIPRRSKVSLNAIVDHVQMLVEGVPKSVPVSYNISKGVPEILFTDEEWVRQMLLKLITNACKHTFSGEITVEVKIGHASGTLLFEVTDTGD
jgi:signal transduction histidine kinase